MPRNACRAVTTGAIDHSGISSRICSVNAYSADPDQPFRAIVITESGDPDHAVHHA
jgi:hypothetical protein